MKSSRKATAAAKPPHYPITRPAQLRALASGLRQEIVDLVQALSTASVPELAQRLRRPADALYYHVRALCRAGLLVEAGSRVRGRHREVLYSTPDPTRPLKLEYRCGNERVTRPLRSLVGSMLRTARGEFDRAISDPSTVVDGPRRELWAARAKGWLAPADLAHANRLLAELAGLLTANRRATRGRLYAIQFVLAPADISPVNGAAVPPRIQPGRKRSER
jgi:hypothetical protein